MHQLILKLLLVLAASPGFALAGNVTYTTMSLSPSATNLPGFVENQGPTPLTHTISYTNPNNLSPSSITGTGSAVASGTALGASGSVMLTNAAAGTYGAGGVAEDFDTFTYSGLPTGGAQVTIDYLYSLDGSLQTDNSLIQANIEILFGGEPCYTQDLTSPGTTNVNQTVTCSYQFDPNSSVQSLAYYSYLQANTGTDFGGTAAITGTASSLFSSTLRLTAINVLDGNGNAIPNITVVNSAGQNPLGTPEPGTFAAGLGGILVVLSQYRLRRK